MALAREVEGESLILRTAEELKGMSELQQPEWTRFVKTGSAKERPPSQENWWWIRGAALLRQVYLERKGVSRLRKQYSSRKNYGHQPEHRAPAGGKIIRVLLQQLEAAGMVKIEKGKGRVITAKGQKFLDGVAKGVDSRKEEVVPQEPKKEAPRVEERKEAPKEGAQTAEGKTKQGKQKEK